MSRLAGILFLPALLVTAQAAGQQEAVPPPEEDGPVIVGGRRENWKTFELIRLESALEFRYLYQRDSLKQNGQEEQRSSETRYRELLDLSTEMSFGHKNLVNLTGTVQLGVEDIFTDTNQDPGREHETDFVNLWDLNALLFGTSAAPTDIFARREQSILDRPFAGNIDETLTEEGIATRIQGESSGATFRYFHRETTLDGGFNDVNSNVTQDSFTAQGTALLTPSQRLEGVYTYDLIDERQSGTEPDSYGRHDANLVHTYTFGQEATPDELRSSLRFYDQGGRQEQRTLRFNELLTLRHTDRLESRYNLTLENRDVRGQSQDLARAEASIRHRLFESLTSAGSIGVQRFAAPDDFTSEEVFANGQLDYTKRVPYGIFDAAVGASINQQTNSDRGSTFRIVDERYVFNDGFPIIIPRRNIVAGSFVVTPAAGFPVFIEGIDYTVTVFSDRAEIRGLVGGAIRDGEVVLVSYDVGPEPGNTIGTLGTTLSVRYTITEGWLDGLALYSTFRTVDHTVEADDPSLFVLDDVRDLLIGTEYVIGGLELIYEYNNHDSTIDPYVVNRVQALYTLPLSLGSSLSADATREWIDYREQESDVTFDRASLRWEQRLTESLRMSARLEYRSEESESRGDSVGLEEILGVNWNKRQTSVFCEVRNSNVEADQSDESSQRLEFGLRRAF